ncbi:uncharacterized protein IL334_005853 [Kwoniella shivajii]|uniref:J domain-containing protein n=1 Tax=Kwoniella shivajii TaxID=564305 RepID=A0ABZ1D4A8_9TREE|nr:hypothetical protein IL334_005853 [Kwoniella shivajii]
MEVNKEEAIRCLSISSRHRSSSNLPSALKFAKKSVALYSTPEGEAMIIAIQREIESGGSSSSSSSSNSQSTSTPKPNGTTTTNGETKGKASGVEEHVTSAHTRPGHGTGSSTKSDPTAAPKKSYTAKQMEVVKRVKGCKQHEYYEILSVEKSCTENDVKKAYKKLALALHPDKNNAPGADEAFKMVSKAFQVLSDPNMKAAFDQNPSYDPTSRNPGMGGGGGGGGGMRGFGGGGPGMYQTEINPEDLFNMFFGGGGGGGGFGGGSPFGQANVFTFGGPGGFQAQYNRPRRPTTRAGGGDNNNEASPIVALLPIIILFLFAFISIIPSLFQSQQIPDPQYSFEPSTKLDLTRETNNWHVKYHLNSKEWENSEIYKSIPDNRKNKLNENLYSSKLRGFERGIENVYARRLQNECQYFLDLKQQRINENSGFFGIGANTDKLKEIRQQRSPACEQLRKWGLTSQNAW